MPALHDIVTKGSTDRSVTIHVMDSTDGTPETGFAFNTAGIDLWYRREGAARVAITEVTLAALTTAHTDGGVLHISDGDVRVDLPDAAYATGANYVDFGGTATGMIVIGGRVRLIDASLEVANLAANVTQISGDATAADNLETMLDDTAGAVPWNGIIDQGTAQSATATTVVIRAGATFGDDVLIGATIMVFGSTQGYWQQRTITDHAGSTDTVTVDSWYVTPSGTITYKIFATAPASSGAPLAANVTQWNGAAITAPAVAGVPNINITHIGGAVLNTASAQIGANVVQLSGDGTAADNAEAYFDGTGYKDPDNEFIIRSSTAQGGAAGSITLDASANANNDFYNDTVIQIVGGTGSGQARFISDYVGATKIATVNSSWVVTPDNTSVFLIIPFSAIPGASAPTVVDIWTYATRRLSDAVNVTSTGGTIPITAGNLVSCDLTAVSTDAVAANNLEAMLDGTGGVNLTATISGNLAGNVTGSVASVAGAVGSVTGGVGSVAGNVGGSILGGMVGSVGGVASTVSANIVRVNGVLVDGSGTTIDPWGPA